MTSRHHWNPHQIQFPKTKYGVQEEVEGQNVSTISMYVSGEVSGEPGYYKDYKEYKEYHQEEVVVHDMDDFNRRLISRICFTGEIGVHSGTMIGVTKKMEILYPPESNRGG